jgi:SanA protein
MKSRLRLWLRRIVLLLLAVVVSILIVDQWVWRSTQAQMYSDIEQLPHHKVGLLLGTSKWGKHHWINFYYAYRIQAAAALFKAGKIDYILVSGDNRHAYYNEPETMQADLINAGVPKGRIVMDYAGFRTLDSVLRCREVFGENEVTIISQPFHNARALFIANRKGMKAIAFNAKDVSGRYGIKTLLREKLARVKMLLDLVFGTEPKFYGPHIPIG